MKLRNSEFTSTAKIVLNTYNDLAEEYYDQNRHPTCANFREGSELIYQNWLPQCWSYQGWICEIGAGRSLIAEMAIERKLDTERLILVDSAPRMLAHSASAIRAGCCGILADASQLPFSDHSLSLLIATLGDPYNTPRFWQEVARVLAVDGVVIYTTPSYVWSSAFRRPGEEEQEVADFELRDGRHILVPSLIYPIDKQIAMLASHGLQVHDTQGVTLDQLQSGHTSPKLRTVTDGDIVTGFQATNR